MLGAPSATTPNESALSDVEVAGVHELWARHVRARLEVIAELRRQRTGYGVLKPGRPPTAEHSSVVANIPPAECDVATARVARGAR